MGRNNLKSKSLDIERKYGFLPGTAIFDFTGELIGGIKYDKKVWNPYRREFGKFYAEVIPLTVQVGRQEIMSLED